MVSGDLCVYRTLKHGPRLAVFVAYVGAKALVRIGGRVRSVNTHNLEAMPL